MFFKENLSLLEIQLQKNNNMVEEILSDNIEFNDISKKRTK
jgi:hypothetical protein